MGTKGVGTRGRAGGPTPPSDHECSPRCPELDAWAMCPAPARHIRKPASVRLCLPLGPGAPESSPSSPLADPQNLGPRTGSHGPASQENRQGCGEPVCSQALPRGSPLSHRPVPHPACLHPPTARLPPVPSLLNWTRAAGSGHITPAPQEERVRSLPQLATLLCTISHWGCHLRDYLQPPALRYPQTQTPKG